VNRNNYSTCETKGHISVFIYGIMALINKNLMRGVIHPWPINGTIAIFF